MLSSGFDPAVKAGHSPSFVLTMDPRDIQNNMNLPGHTQQQMMNPQDHYNQMLLQQQYMNQFSFYNQNQVIGVDPFHQQQYNNMMLQQQIPMFQQPQHIHPQQVLSQQSVPQQSTLTHEHQRFLQETNQLQQNQHQTQLQTQHQTQIQNQLHTQLQSQLQTQLQNQLLQNQRSAQHQAQHQTQRPAQHRAQHSGVTVQHQAQHQVSQALSHSQLQGQLQATHSTGVQNQHASSLHSGVQSHQALQTQMTAQHALHQSPHVALSNQLNQLSALTQGNTPVHQLQHLQQQTQPRLQAAQATQQLQQQLSLHEQQRLLEEQARQIEIKRQEENTRKQKEQADRLEREEMMKKQREQREQREKEHQEKLRQQIEADRLAEERKVKEDREVKEREKLKRIRDEHMKKQKEDEKLQQECTSRVSNIQQPLALVGTHFINNFVRIIPFPSEHLESSGLTAVCSTEDLPILDHSNPNIVKMISHALSAVNIRDIKTRLDQHGELAETNDLPLDQMPRLIKDVMEYNCNALDVEPEHNMCIAETEHLLLTAIKDDMNRPITSTLGGTMSANPSPHVPNKEPPKVAIQLDQEAIKLRRQMASVGKQPKAQAQRKKRDMVESLFDSLTDYFDPTQGRRRRNRTKTFEEEQSEQGDGEGEDKEKDIDLKEELQSEDDENKFYDKKKKRKKEEPEERPPTPTEVIHERELEWNERQRKRLEKRKRRKCEENVQDYWNNDVMAENDSFNRFTALVDQILDQVEDMDVLMTCGKSDDEEEDDEVSQELLIERSVLDDLRNQTQKLKSWKKLNRVPVDRLVKLETMLERNMKDVISQDGSRLLVPVLLDENTEEEDLTFKELVHDRLARAADAACTALMVMTSYKMPKQVFIEDTIERAINLCKQYLNHIIFPASDSVFRSNNSSKKVKADDPRRKRKAGVSNRSHSIQKIYDRIADLVGCFAELVRVQPLPETSIHHLASMAIASFFVSNVGELQRQAMILASNIFSKNNESVRIGILHDILNSLHRLPPGKNTNNSYRLGPEQWISNTTVLIMQLIQSSVKMPRRKKHEEEDKKGEVNPDSIVKDSIRDAQKLAGSFLSGFLSKCANKGSKTDGEEDYRRLFEAFLQDLLAALHKPAWPASELILSILGTLLVKYYRAKSTDIVIRQACLDYLGSITARLRKDTKSAEEDSAKRFEIVLKAIIYDDEEEPQFENVSDVDISEYSSLERLKKLEQALIDYLIEKNGEDITVEYAINFYAAEWYKETVEDLEVAKQNFKSDKSTELTDKEKRKLEKKMDKMQEKTQVMKDFLIRLVEKKHVRRRTEHIKKTGNIMMDLDAAWTVKYLASKREFTHSFQQYLKIIIYGIQVENTVSLRTKAMKCLTQIIEADYEVLGMNDVRQAVNSRMIDPNAAVREATIELLGKFLLVKEEFIPSYYNILLERIKDSGTAVRKRVIRIMREICEKYPNYNQIPDMLSKLVRRISDEDGVKKLVQETFMALWFQPCSDKFVDQLCKKVLQMTSVAQLCANDSTTDFFEQLLHNVLKTADKSMLEASKQIVDALVDSIIALEKKIAVDVVKSTSDLDDDTILNVQKENQERMLASLTTLSMFSKVRPELLVRHAETLQPYLSMSARSQSEQSVLNEVICMLERVVPLMSHPSDSFLQSLDESLSNLLMNSGMVIVVSVVACAAAVYNNFPRKQTSMTHKFLYFLRNMNSVHANYKTNDKYVPQPSHMVMLQRSLFSLGLLCRYFDFDAMLENDAEAAKSLVMANLPPNQSVSENIEVTDSPERRRYRDNVFALLTFFSKSANQAIRLKAISSIGHLCARHAEYLGRDEIKHMYRLVLSTSEARYLQLKIQALKNLEMFLLAEEKKLMKGNEEWDKAKEQQNLKEMELAGSGLGSAVIQIYWLNVLNCYFHVDSVVRQSAVQVTWLTLSQGLVTPGSSIASLIAMTTDPIIPIRNKVENLLKEIDIKYAGMVQSKAIAGIRISYKLHLMINSDKFSIVRGIRVCDSSSLSSTARTNLDHFGLPRFSNDGQAILSGLYQSLRGNRSHRRSFLNSVLRLFSDDCREKLPLSEWIFVADNIAMFPYQVMDEPLYAIRHIDGIIALSGQAILNQFKDRLISSPYGGLDDDDSLFEPDHIYRRFPENKSELFDLMVNSQACFILLYLKNFLMKLYGFTEAKVQEYSPSEPAKVYEKAVTRRNVPMFQPHSALEEMRPEVIEERNTTQGHYKLAHKICNFRKMLLAIDRNDEDAVDGKEEGITGGVTEREDDEDDVDHGASEIDEQSIADGKDMEE